MQEIDKAWKMVDAAHEKEKRAKRTTQQLKQEIQNLSRLVDQVWCIIVCHKEDKLMKNPYYRELDSALGRRTPSRNL